MQPIAKFCILAALLISAAIQLRAQETWWFIQNVNLIFHEAGHVLFMFFGQFLHLIGGSLFEILVPIAITIHFARRADWFAAGCTSWWVCTAFLSVSIYISDAQERILPLITNDITTHDWFNILNQLHLLKYDDLIGYIFWCFATLSLGGMIYFGSKDSDIKNLFVYIKKYLQVG